MKYSINVNKKRGQVVVQVQGDLDAEMEKCMFNDIITHPMWSAHYNLLFDHSDCHWGHLSNNEIRNRAQLISKLSQHFDESKMAIVLSSDLDFGLGRMLEAYTFEELSGKIHIFHNLNEADSWLD